MIFGLVCKLFRSKLYTFSKRKLVTVAGNQVSKTGNCSKMEEVPNQNCIQKDAKSIKRPFEISHEAESAPVEETVKRARSQKKKKFAILLSYCGQGYLGMQFNQGFKTIEGELFQAFLKLGIMDDDSLNTPQSIHFQRAARTDKGVSAIRQVISLKMRLPDENLCKELNSLLSHCVRVFAVRKVTAGFNSKTACDSRSYAYVMPTFAFASKEVAPSHQFRLISETVDQVNSLLSFFKGTRNYHNFTSGRPAQDPSCKRYVTQFSCSLPFIVKDMEFVKITIKGQSFMLHQIRKMIGLTVAIMRGYTSKEILEKAFKMERVNIPTAPSLNLLLEEL
ncbi:pseudouridylate synthase 1 homolog isoform X2 [Daphnia carinata]|uniref:pseudouridylate synthase 1 homolog isoform X2 n=1 Tax=Daphnia carinata TaxID=120202 RepID=UPI002579EDC5|nr:pseudouridylate synthase 1 homolog isoform X2 [Daphnia carinata]